MTVNEAINVAEKSKYLPIQHEYHQAALVLAKEIERLKKTLYMRIDLEPGKDSDESVQYVGCYVTKWGRVDEPTVAFRIAAD